ncbi:corepressor interacting with RBPJ 1-like isoform X2 [Nilaparvata lugens]|uniref:corepressor interacting with RBPJ 1-like isoform X2 n=1 Tax=Nilaparvata lugens TaxID=108931 RepID=UPI00193DE259|nr:corepressor interacting with RBPJ 1-like isoform X2 [Nilaparvata lugens]
MFQCENCDATFHGRSQFLVHISNRNCTGVKSTYNSDEESEEVYDTDKDPNWSPSSLKDSTIPLAVPMSSPITEEQIKEAAVLENIIFDDDDDFDEMDGNSKPSFKRKLFLNEEMETDDKNSQSTEIQNIQKKIQECKSDRKLAIRSGKKSKGRRLNRRISKLQKSMESPDNSSSTTTSPTTTTTTTTTTTATTGTDTPNKKIERKQNYCLYCEKMVKKFGEHLQKTHPDKPEGFK